MSKLSKGLLEAIFKTSLFHEKIFFADIDEHFDAGNRKKDSFQLPAICMPAQNIINVVIAYLPVVMVGSFMLLS